MTGLNSIARQTEVRSTPRNAAGVLFGLLLILYVWPIYSYPSVNVYAHVDQAAAVVLDGTLAIDRFVRPQTNTIDWSQASNGHYYPAKAPGAGLMAVPAFWTLYQLERVAGVNPLERDWFRRNIVLINWIMNALPSACAMMLLFRLSLSLGIAARPAMIGTIAIALGTAYYPYATTYYAHAPAANAIIVAATLIFRPDPRPPTDFAAGLSVSVAVLFDYPAAFAVVIFACALTVLRPRALLPYLAGGCIGLAILLWYNATTFGRLWTTAYTYQNSRFSAPDRSFLNWPRPWLIGSLTVSPYRGLFVFSPVMLVGFYGAWVALRRGCQGTRAAVLRSGRVFALCALAVFALWLLLNASYGVWWGGWTAGPRFIIPALVLFGPLIALGSQRLPRASLVLLGVSVLNYFAIAAVGVVLDDHVTNPLRQAIYPHLLTGELYVSNVGIFLGLHGLSSLIPPVAVAFVALTTLWRLTSPVTEAVGLLRS